jgi:hypothetical protein
MDRRRAESPRRTRVPALERSCWRKVILYLARQMKSPAVSCGAYQIGAGGGWGRGRRRVLRVGVFYRNQPARQLYIGVAHLRCRNALILRVIDPAPAAAGAATRAPDQSLTIPDRGLRARRSRCRPEAPRESCRRAHSSREDRRRCPARDCECRSEASAPVCR